MSTKLSLRLYFLSHEKKIISFFFSSQKSIEGTIMTGRER